MTTDIKLQAISNLISDYLASGRDILVSTQRLLTEIQEIIKSNDMNKQEINSPPIKTEELIEEAIIISCDASIKKNPGGPASVGVVVRQPNDSQTTQFGKKTPAQTNNEAEYDAIYEGLLFIANTINRPKYPIIIRSDSQLVVSQLMGKFKINEDALLRKSQSIHELAKALPVPVKVEWMPRNSTPDLEQANFLAQDVLGVKRH